MFRSFILLKNSPQKLISSASSRLISSGSPCSSAHTAVTKSHCDFLENMYAIAPVSGLINTHVISFDTGTEGGKDATGDTTLTGFTAEKKHCHTMGAMHGSCYFKLLDDAAFFAAQARETDCFVLTVNFNLTLLKPVLPGTELVARGRVISASKSIIVAESSLFDADGTLLATGSGTFMKNPKLNLEALRTRMNL